MILKTSVRTTENTEATEGAEKVCFAGVYAPTHRVNVLPCLMHCFYSV